MPSILRPGLKPGALNAGKLGIALQGAFTVALGLIICTGAYAGDTVYTLRMKFHAGETRKYHTSVSLSLEPMGANPAPRGPAPTATPVESVSSFMLYKVVRVQKDGSADIEVTTISGQNLHGPLARNDQPVRMTFDVRGRLLSIKGLVAVQGSIVSNMIGSSALGGQGAALPKDPVRIGGKWTEPVYMPHVGTGKVEGTLVKVEKVGKYKTLLLHYVVTTPVKTMLDANFKPTTDPAKAAATATGPMIIQFDNDFSISDGKLVRTSGTGIGRLTLEFKDNRPIKAGVPKPKPPAAIPLTINLSIGTELVD